MEYSLASAVNEHDLSVQWTANNTERVYLGYIRISKKLTEHASKIVLEEQTLRQVGLPVPTIIQHSMAIGYTANTHHVTGP